MAREQKKVRVPPSIYDEAKALQRQLRQEKGVHRPLWECVSMVREQKRELPPAMRELKDVFRGFGL